MKRGTIDALNWGGLRETPGIFAGGDCVSGPATVVRAIAGGKVVAANVDEYLGFHHELEVGVEVPPVRLHDRKPCGRVTMVERPAEERKHDFEIMEICMTEEEAMQEGQRCMRCDHFGYGIFKGGRKEKW